MEREAFENRREPKAFSSDRGAARRAHALLRSAMSDHHVGPGDQLVENLISNTLSTSRNAVRQALQMLAREGMVRREPHNGTRIIREMVRVPADKLSFFGMSIEEARARVEVRLLECQVVPATPLVSRVLDLPGDTMLVVENLVLVDGEPVFLDAGYHRADLPLDRFAISVDQNDVFQRYYQTSVGCSESTLQATLADAATARLLQIAEGSPLMMRELIMRDIRGRARELRHSRYRADRVAFTATAHLTSVGEGHQETGGGPMDQACRECTAQPALEGRPG